MLEHVAHSEQNWKPNVRHLRREVSEVVRYGQRMQMRIKELRTERGWTVDHLASLVNMSRSYVSEIENGKKPANALRIQKFADAFGIPVFQLLDEQALGEDERKLLSMFSSMEPNKRAALLTIVEDMAN